jgi:mycofactocin precursor peptide peptidase
MMLNLSPELVQMQFAVCGDTRPLTDTWPLLRSGGVRAVSATGILGDPTGATAVEGSALLDRLTAQLILQVNEWVSPRAAELA